MEVRKYLSEAGCVLEGEFFFALKKRDIVSKKYINIDPILTDPWAVMELGQMLIEPFLGKFNAIVGPAIGGIPLTYASAFAAIRRSLGCRLITTAFGEKAGDGFAFNRMGFKKAVTGRKVLVVEDISSTGGTTKSICKLTGEAGGEVIGVSLIWNRGGITADALGVPELHSLVEEGVQIWNVSDNPPGWGGLPLVSDIGHPEYYPDYPGGQVQLL